jgi:hypothetical protein
MIDNLSPTMAFMMVDFPTLGFPIILTKPALCDICFNPLKISAKIDKKDDLTSLFPLLIKNINIEQKYGF